ncbi:MAG: integrase core domain-containing protein [Chloroflexota bacterium]
MIKQIAVENRRWGIKRIRGELLKLEILVNKGTIRHYMWSARREFPPPHHGQTWATFLVNHASDTWACDFVQTYDVCFRSIFLFFIIEHGSRRVVSVGITRSPNDVWLAQQMREATPFGVGLWFLIGDNAANYGTLFEHAVAGAAIELIYTPPYAPKANALCERFVGSVRRECLDFALRTDLERSLGPSCRARVRDLLQSCPSASRHRSTDPGARKGDSTANANRKVIGLPILHGLHPDYRWAA